MMRQGQQNELVGNRLLSILIVSGVSLSAITFFIFADNNQDTAIVTLADGGLCANGLCHLSSTDTIPVGTFVQQAEVSTTSSIENNSEVFSNLKAIKNIVMKPEISDNVITMYVSKDSFIREAVQNANEGSSDVIRVMGSGPTTNRALVAFDQSSIESLTQGKTIESAKLMLYVISNDERWNNGQNLSAHLLTTNWSEGSSSNAPFSPITSQKGVTWDCSTDIANCDSRWNGGLFLSNPSASVKVTNDVNGQWIEFDVTNDVKSFSDGATNNGWIIMKDDENASGRINFAAKESKTNVPQLIITLS